MEPEPRNKKRQGPPPIEFLKPGETQAPPPAAPQAPVAWVPSPDEYQRRAVPAPEAVARRPGRRGTVAGVFLVVSGVLGFVGIVSTYLVPLTIQDYYNYTNYSQTQLVVIGAVQTLIVWPEVFALLGAILAFERKSYRLAAVCAFLSTLNLYTPGFLGTLLGILGLVLLMTARGEFTS